MAATTKKRRSGLSFSLGTRIALIMALVIVLAVGSAVVVTFYQGNAIAQEAANAALKRSATAQEQLQAQYRSQLEQLGNVFSDQYLVAYLAEGINKADAFSILDLLVDRQADLGYNFAIVLNPEGRVVVRTDRRDAAGQDLSGRPLVIRAQERGSLEVGLWSEEGVLFNAVVNPMVTNFELVGFMVAGYKIDDLFAGDLAEASGTEVAILGSTAVGMQVLAASLKTVDRTDLVTGLVQAKMAGGVDHPHPRVELDLGGSPWIARITPLLDAADEPVGATVALASLDAQLAPYRRIQQALLVVGGGSILLALLLSFALSRRTLGPVRRLVASVEAARQGDYDQRVIAERADEVGRLAGAYDELLAELREKRDMQAYLAHLSKSLPEPGKEAVAAEPEERQVTLLAAELRRYARLHTVEDPAAAISRLDRDLRRVASAVSSRRGHLESVAGHRVLASFDGDGKSLRALGAGVEILRAVTAPENAFDEPAEATVAVAGGRVAAGGVAWGDGLVSSTLGPPVQKLEALMREAAPGELTLTKDVHGELQGELTGAGIEILPFRGVLSPLPLYALKPEQAASLAGADTAAAAPTVVTQRRIAIADLGPGRSLGMRFEILSQLGAGGMGVVYKARDRELGELVALKVLRRDLLDEPAHLERLKDELRLARKITHPNVLRTYDFGEFEGIHYISMEYVRGVTLRYMLSQDERLPFSAALRVGKQLCAGLAAAHQEGVIHRDIKPDNIILDQAGNARLMDFGIARPLQRQTPGPTQDGFTVGTPQFMAPEQIEGREVDGRTDLYACGVVLFELFTGRLPFSGETPVQIALRQLNEPPPSPREFWPEMPQALERAILSCLAKKPEDRPSSAAELYRTLEALSA